MQGWRRNELLRWLLNDPADTHRTAEIDNPTERWAGPVIFFVIGVISFGVRYARSAKEISEA